jgi:hypothetical protein
MTPDSAATKEGSTEELMTETFLPSNLSVIKLSV